MLMETNQYLEMFIEESKEHLQACIDHLLELEKDPQNLQIINEIFRSAHTLKGMSATMGYEDLANLTHQMENVLDGIRNEKLAITSELLDVIFQSVDDLEAMVVSIADGGDGKRDVSQVVSLLMQIESGETLAATQTAAGRAVHEFVATSVSQIYDSFEQTVILQSIEQGFSCFEMTVTLRQDCLLKAARVFMVFEVLEKVGEIIKSTPTTDQLEKEEFESSFTVTLVTMEGQDEVQAKVMKISEIEEVVSEKVDQATFETGRTREEPSQPTSDSSGLKKDVKVEASDRKATKSIRVNIERLDRLMNLFEELVIDKGRLEQLSKDLDHKGLRETVEHMSRISGDLQDIILKMRMVPIDTVFNRFPRMVRQLSKDLKKEIEFSVEGAETELDRTVIDEIGDPLVHLIRNALDHGIETPEVRTANGKPAQGTLLLKAFHSGNHVFIEIRDDGAGINRDKVLEKAVSKGIVTEEEGQSLPDEKVYELIFASGFSTADQVSDISGRGVGLDVVKSTIEFIEGTITIQSVPQKGSLFSIQLPMTLSIMTVLLIELQKEIYAIPLSSIMESVIVQKEEIIEAHEQKVFDYRGKVIPLIFLNEVFDVQTDEREDEYYSIVIVRKGETYSGLVVDSFIGQQEVVLKPLGQYLSEVHGISGATILGDGQVALIVDCNTLLK